MKEVMAIVRMNCINKTKRALADSGISSMTARDALGRGKGLVDIQLLKGAEKGYEEAISQLGSSQRLIPESLVAKTVKTIIKVNQTGKPGDGKIFVSPILDSISVRTGQSGDPTLDEVE